MSSCRNIFEESLWKVFVQHLRLQNHFLFGTRLYITPLNSYILWKVRLVLSMVEGSRILKLNYWGVLKLFEHHCSICFPEEYTRKLHCVDDVFIIR